MRGGDRRRGDAGKAVKKAGTGGLAEPIWLSKSASKRTNECAACGEAAAEDIPRSDGGGGRCGVPTRSADPCIASTRESLEKVERIGVRVSTAAVCPIQYESGLSGSTETTEKG